jgi:hypothetical protein
MRKLLIALTACTMATTAQAWPWSPSSYSECILDKMPGTQNTPMAIVNGQACKAAFPAIYNTWDDVKKYDPADTDECIVKHAKNTPDQNAARWIVAACVHIHGPR